MTATLTAMTSPYPGLRPYGQEDADLFFGRGKQVADMILRLDDHRFLAVVGASGSGKSSLVRAGLLPALEQGFLPSAAVGDPWRMIVIQPGNAPLRNLAFELVRKLGTDLPPEERGLQTAYAYATLRTGAKGLIQLIEQAALPDNAHVLIVVDQFEELFRFRKQITTETGEPDAESLSYREEATTLVSLLLHTAAQKDRSIHVIITMRSDFMGDCDAFHGLPEAINKCQFLTPRLERDEAEDAIVGPARACGGDVEEKLVNRILNEIGNSPDQLPLMQHVLMRLWNQAVNAEKAKPEAGKIVLRLDKYEAMGGLAGAIDYHAEEVFAKLTKDQQWIAEVLFRCLSDRDRGGRTSRDTRRPTELKNIAEVAGATIEQTKEVVEIFRARDMSFLMPRAEAPIDADTRLDISHESLLRRWKRVAKWVENESTSAEIYRRLEETARKFSGDFLNPGELTYMQDWVERDKPNAIWAKRYGGDFARSMEFLMRSKVEEDRRADKEREGRKKKQWLNKMYWVTGVASIGIIVAIGLIIWLVFVNQNAQEATAKAKEYAQQEAEAKKAAQRSLDDFKAADANRRIIDLASQVGLVSTPQRGVLKAMAASELLLETERNKVAIFDDTRLAANSALRRSLSLMGGLGFYGEHSETSGFAIFDQKDSPKKWLVTTTLGGVLHLWEMWNKPDRDANGRLVPIEPPPLPVQLDYHDGAPRYMEIAGRWLIVQGSKGNLLAWDLGTETPKLAPIVLSKEETWDTPYISAHKNAIRLRVPTDKTNQVRLWSLRPNPPHFIMVPLEFDAWAVRENLTDQDLSFSPDGRWFTLTRLKDGLPVFWDLLRPDGPGKSLALPAEATHKAPPGQRLMAGEFTSDDRFVVCYSGGGIRVWKLQADKWLAGPLTSLPTQFDAKGKEKVELDVSTDRRGLWAVAVPKKRKDGIDNKYNPPAGAGGPLKHQAELFDLSRDLAKFEECGTLLDKFQDVNTFDPHPFRVHKTEKHTWVLASVQFGGFRLWDLRGRDPKAPQSADAPGLASSVLSALNLRPANIASGDSVRFSPDGRWVFQASTLNHVVAWDLWSFNNRIDAPWCILRGHDQNISDFRLSGDGRWLVSLGLDNTLRAWDVDNLSTTAEPRETRNPVDLATLDITPDRDWLAVSRQDGTLRLWNPTRTAISSLDQSHTLDKWAKNEFASLRFSEDGRWLLAYRIGGAGTLWDLRGKGEPQKHCTLELKPGPVTRLIVNHTNEWVAATFANPGKPNLVSLDSSIRLWRVNAAKVAEKVQDATGVAHAFNEADRKMIIETAATIEFLDLNDKVIKAQKNASRINLGETEQSRIWKPLITPDGKVAVVFSDSRDSGVWDLGSANQAAALKDCQFLARDRFLTSANGRWLVYKDANDFRLWDLDQWGFAWILVKEIPATFLPERNQEETGKKSAVGSRSLIVSPDRRWLLVIQDPGKPGAGVGKLHDLGASGSRDVNIREIPLGDNIESAAFSADSRRLVTTKKDSIHVWDLLHPKGIPFTEIRARDNKGVMNASVGFSPAGAQNGPVAFSPDEGRWLAIAGRDGLIRVWDRHTEREPTVMHGHQLVAPFVLFVTPDGDRVISVELERKIIRVSTLPMDGFLNLAERTVGRKPREDERK